MKTYLCKCILFIAAAVAAGCQKEFPGQGGGCPCTGGTAADISFNISRPDTGFRTRSSVSSGEDNINDINIFAYCDGLLEGAVYAQATDRAGMKLTSGKKYTFYVLANTGQITAPEKEDGMTGCVYGIEGMADFSSKGFPMASVKTADIDGTSKEVDILLDRLIAKVDLKIDTGSLPGFKVTSAQLVNSPKNIMPFSAGSGATSTIAGDRATADDIANLNAGKTATFYMLENCQGILLPGNKDQWAKIPENIPDEKEKLCTYMEVSAELDGSSGVQGPVTYRFYLGQDETTDFNIFRNTENRITLITTEDGLDKVSWRIDNSRLSPVSIPVIAVGASGKIFYTGSDGTLTQVTLGDSDWNCVTYGNGKYIAVGDNGSIGYSTDGIKWSITKKGTYNWNAVTFGNGKFVAAGSGGGFAYSANGTSWTTTEKGSTEWNSITYGNGMFVAVGQKDSYTGSLGYSSDGVTWTASSTTQYAYLRNAVAFGNGLFIAVGKRDLYTGTLGYSSDGKSWNYNTKVGSVEHTAIGYGDGKFLIAGRNELMYSEDGLSWKSSEETISGLTSYSIAFGDGMFAIAGPGSTGRSRIYFSSNLNHWIQADAIKNTEINGICVMH